MTVPTPPDLIVVNSGANDVIIEPGLPGGGYDPVRNDWKVFPTGTDPVSVTVADVNGDGRPDLIVADRGSNDVTILLNEPQGDSFTFVPGPRLKAGTGPVGTALIPANGNPDHLVISDSGRDERRRGQRQRGANDLDGLTILQGLGHGFFDDTNPTFKPLEFSPGPFVAPPNASAASNAPLITINPNGTVTQYNILPSGSMSFTTISSGGADPVAGLAVQNPDGSEDLVVANYGSGSIALFAVGAQGLSLIVIQDPPGLSNPTDLAAELDPFQSGALDVYATTAGVDSASLVTFLLGGTSRPGPGEQCGPDAPAVQRVRAASGRHAAGPDHRDRSRVRGGERGGGGSCYHDRRRDRPLHGRPVLDAQYKSARWIWQ